MPTSFKHDFKPIAEKNEFDNRFWDLYQTRETDMWYNFENLLARPDFNKLEQIFEDSYPDYTSDRESDRDTIIAIAEYSADLNTSLNEFAQKAEDSLIDVKSKKEFQKLFSNDDWFINFNYTHTLEKIYNIPYDHVLHIHGEVDSSPLLMGFEEGNFSPEDYYYDATKKGRHFIHKPLKDYINDYEQFDDYYVHTAYNALYDRCESLFKKNQGDKLWEFIKLIEKNEKIESITTFGISFGIDIGYLWQLESLFDNKLNWFFYCHDYNTYKNLMDNFLYSNILSPFDLSNIIPRYTIKYSIYDNDIKKLLEWEEQYHKEKMVLIQV
jgi:hypothetical protein